MSECPITNIPISRGSESLIGISLVSKASTWVHSSRTALIHSIRTVQRLRFICSVMHLLFDESLYSFESLDVGSISTTPSPRHAAALLKGSPCISQRGGASPFKQLVDNLRTGLTFHEPDITWTLNLLTSTESDIHVAIPFSWHPLT